MILDLRVALRWFKSRYHKAGRCPSACSWSRSLTWERWGCWAGWWCQGTVSVSHFKWKGKPMQTWQGLANFSRKWLLFRFLWWKGTAVPFLAPSVPPLQVSMQVSTRHLGHEKRRTRRFCWIYSNLTGQTHQTIWVNYSISLTWMVRPFGDDFPH